MEFHQLYLLDMLQKLIQIPVSDVEGFYFVSDDCFFSFKVVVFRRCESICAFGAIRRLHSSESGQVQSCTPNGDGCETTEVRSVQSVRSVRVAVVDSSLCMGCTACSAQCAKRCITFHRDESRGVPLDASMLTVLKEEY